MKEYTATITVHFKVATDSEVSKIGLSRTAKSEISKLIREQLELAYHDKVEISDVREMK